MNSTTILTVEDDHLLQESIADLLGLEGIATVQAHTAQEALATMERVTVSAVLLDLVVPGAKGLDLFERIHSRWDVPIVIMTGYGSIQVAVEAMRAGAADFLTKPMTPETLGVIIAKALERNRLLAENRRLREEVFSCFGRYNLVGRSHGMERVYEKIKIVAPTDSTVLLTGETGTGKEVVARAIHDGSPRRAGPFVALNCAAVTGDLFEAELFGHVKGAFTGAVQARRGRFEEAHQGTLFLDEIGLLDASIQGKLLRVLEEPVVHPVGGGSPVPVDVRVIAATNVDLKRDIGDNKFRDDLYYRLCVFPIQLPPLRERRDDIPLLVEYLLGRIGKRTGSPPKKISEHAMSRLLSHDWPGNVRELTHVLERSVLTCTAPVLGDVDIERAGAEKPAGAAIETAKGESPSDDGGTFADLAVRFDEIERKYWQSLFMRANGDPMKMSLLSGACYQTVRRKSLRYCKNLLPEGSRKPPVG